MGVGWGHLGLDLREQLLNSPVPLTYENIQVYFLKGTDTTSYVLSIAFAVFGATGLIGFVLLYSLVIRLIKRLLKLRKLCCEYAHVFLIYSFLFIA